jgi:hypothetical protein
VERGSGLGCRQLEGHQNGNGVTEQDSSNREFPGNPDPDFERQIEAAYALASSGQVEASEEILLQLAGEYVRAARIFLLLASLKTNLGNVVQGEKYRTLYDVLKGIFESVLGSTAEPLPERHLVSETGLGSFEAVRQGTSCIAERNTRDSTNLPGILDVAPVTVAMGRQFLKQGHFRKALNIFNKLLEQKPEDSDLLNLQDQAAIKVKETHVVNVLHHWLQNIGRIKNPESEKHEDQP